MNTPNPNPSPELCELIDILKAATEADGLTIYEHSAAEIGLAVMDCRADLRAALTPPTPAETVTVALPGAGEVEAYRVSWFVGDEPRKRVQLTASLEPWLAVLNPVVTPLYATVAAANDEGVADDPALERRVRIAAWNAAKKSGATDELGYAVVEAVVAEFAAIRLLSQEGGK